MALKAPLTTTIRECRAWVTTAREGGRRIAFVPTMGALHEGHLSLVDRARAVADRVVLSVFVNPLQFGPAEDYAAYPRDLERDLELAGERDVDLVFAPSRDEMFPAPPLTRVTMRAVTEGLEGAARPGHFDGVLTVVAKLFHVVLPDVAVFGQKDAQQAAAIRRMVADLAFPVEVLVAPTVREESGLACSSRNAYLSDEEREMARGLYRALEQARAAADGGERDPARIEAAMRQVLAGAKGVELEYVAVVDPERFRPIERLDRTAIAAIAARVGGTRLIDNIVLGSDGR